MMAIRNEQTEVEANNIGKYRLIASLGRGGMASIHLAVARGPAGFNKLLVLKQIHPEYVEDPEILGMFLDEAQLSARLSHPNVVQTNEVGHEGDRHFLAMEYLDGQPLNRITRRLARHGGLPLVLHLRIIADLLNGLHYAHELADYDGTPLGIVHRDVTPQNIFVTYDGTAKIIDFGIAKAQTALVQTQTGIIKGKIAYMAPEQARGEEVDRRADIFAVGVMLWEAATGRRPWEGLPELTVIKKLLNGHFPTPRSIKPDVAPALEAIILKAISHDRRDRYDTAADLQAAVEAYIMTSGERAQQRELGLLISRHFAAERSELKSVIEEQLRAIPAAVAASALPIIDEHTSANGDAQRDSAPSTTGSSSLEGSTLGTQAILPQALVREAGQPGSRSRFGSSAWMGAFFAAGVLIAASGLSLRWGAPRAEMASVAAAPAAKSANPEVSLSAQQAAPSPTVVRLRVTASPPAARLFLDGVPLDGNPWTGDLPRDLATHEMRVEAPGFIDRTEPVTLSNDRTFTIVLTAEPLPPQPLAGRMGTRPVRGHKNQKTRPVDASNPYAP